MTQTPVRFGIVVFPGSNCDHDAYHVCRKVLGQDAVFLWHKDADLKDVDVVILPGGFSYGDYLRCGAIARFSPVMREVIRFAEAGGLVLGICNGFQILVEAGLLPGVLLRNASLRFACKHVQVRVENAFTPFTSVCAQGDVLTIPIAHGDGNYFADEETIRRLEANGQVAFRYCSAVRRDHGRKATRTVRWGISRGSSTNGGTSSGMMPHPERAADPLLGHTDGQKVFASLLEHVLSRVATRVGGEEAVVTGEKGRS